MNRRMKGWTGAAVVVLTVVSMMAGISASAESSNNCNGVIGGGCQNASVTVAVSGSGKTYTVSGNFNGGATQQFVSCANTNAPMGSPNLFSGISLTSDDGFSASYPVGAGGKISGTASYTVTQQPVTGSCSQNWQSQAGTYTFTFTDPNAGAHVGNVRFTFGSVSVLASFGYGTPVVSKFNCNVTPNGKTFTVQQGQTATINVYGGCTPAVAGFEWVCSYSTNNSGAFSMSRTGLNNGSLQPFTLKGLQPGTDNLVISADCADTKDPDQFPIAQDTIVVTSAPQPPAQTGTVTVRSRVAGTGTPLAASWQVTGGPSMTVYSTTNQTDATYSNLQLGSGNIAIYNVFLSQFAPAGYALGPVVNGQGFAVNGKSGSWLANAFFAAKNALTSFAYAATQNSVTVCQGGGYSGNVCNGSSPQITLDSGNNYAGTEYITWYPVSQPQQGGVKVSASCNPSSIKTGATSQCTATVTGTSNTAVTWSVKNGGGSVNANGLYTAPATPGSVVILATSKADSSASNTASVTVTNNPSNSGGPTVTLTPSSTTVYPGQSVPITITSTGATSCAKSGNWSGSVACNGTVTVTAPSAPGTYNYTVTGTDSNGNSSSDTTTVVVKSPTITVTTTPSSTITSNGSASCKATVTGSSQTVVWTITGAASYTISGDTVTVYPSTGGTIVCKASLPSSSSSDSATITVIQTPPSCTISASPTSVVVPQATTISYSCKNVDHSPATPDCTLSGGSFGSGSDISSGYSGTSLFGTTIDTPSTNTTYTIVCHGVGPYTSTSSSANVTVNVTNPGRGETNP